MFAWRTDFASVAKMCSNGEVDALSNVLLKKPRMVEETSKTGATLLHIACHRGRLDICIVLLLKGAKIDCIDDMGFTPLMVCAQFKQSDCARMLIARGADVNMVNKRRQTALHIAAIFGSSDIIPPLLDNSAEINGVDIEKNKGRGVFLSLCFLTPLPLYSNLSFGIIRNYSQLE